MDYKQKYNEAFEKAKGFYDNEECRVGMTPVDLEVIFPELKDTKDERIRKELIQYLTDYPTLPNGRYSKNDFFDWLKKQSKSSVKWNKNTEGNKPPINHSILMKTTQGIAEGEWKGENWFQYRWSSQIKDNDVLAWVELSDLNNPKFKRDDIIIDKEDNIYKVINVHNVDKNTYVLRNLYDGLFSEININTVDAKFHLRIP